MHNNRSQRLLRWNRRFIKGPNCGAATSSQTLESIIGEDQLGKISQKNQNAQGAPQEITLAQFRPSISWFGATRTTTDAMPSGLALLL
jgi:hypothetical protein